MGGTQTLARFGPNHNTNLNEETAITIPNMSLGNLALGLCGTVRDSPFVRHLMWKAIYSNAKLVDTWDLYMLLSASRLLVLLGSRNGRSPRLTARWPVLTPKPS